VTDLRALLTELAHPRRTGSATNVLVRDVLKRELTARGFVVMEQRFRAAPRWPLWGTKPTEGCNLIAVRPRTRVTTWLAAHYDSKGQPVSMAARLILVGATVAALVIGVVAAVLGGGWGWWVPLLDIGSMTLAFNRVNDGSPGAVDNTTGLLTVLATVDFLPADAAVGILFPDGEELGLTGARALVRERANLFADTAVINLDGIDDRGRATVLVHKPGPVGDAIARGLSASRWRRLPVVVDGMVLAQATRECVTIMKGDWQTMRVVHRPGDTVERLTLEGVQAVAESLAPLLFPG
jgi:peptidase M28-like protein